MNEADHSLWTGWRERHDEHAFQTLVEPHVRFAHDIARRWGCSDADADDVVQDALTRLAQEPTGRPIEVGLRAWLGREVSLRARMRRRGEGRRRRREQRVAARQKREAADADTSSGPIETVERELASLPPSWREAIILRYLHDLDYKDLAEVLGVSEAACRVRVHRGIARLRERLGPGAGAMVAALPLRAPAEATIATAALATASTGLPLLGILVMPKVVAAVGVVAILGAVMLVGHTMGWFEGGASDGGKDGDAGMSAPHAEQRADDGPRLRSGSRRPVERPVPSRAMDAESGASGSGPSRAGIPEALRPLLEQIYEHGGKVAVDGKPSEEPGAWPELLWLDDLHTLGARVVKGVQAGEGDRVRWLSLVGDLQELRHLELTKTDLRPDDLVKLPMLPQLRVLLVGETRVGDADVRTLEDFFKLERLVLSQCPITGESLSALEALPLRDLDVSHTAIRAEAIEGLARFKGLRKLSLAGTGVDDRDLRPLGSLGELESIDLSFCTQIGEDGFRWGGGGRMLKRIVLRDSGLEDERCSWPAGLEVLDLSHTKAKRRVLDSLDRRRALREVDLTGTPVEFQDLQGELRHMVRRTKLKRLVLRNTKLTESEILKLEKRHPALEFVR